MRNAAEGGAASASATDRRVAAARLRPAEVGGRRAPAVPTLARGLVGGLGAAVEVAGARALDAYPLGSERL
jgi:hypothetical protein